MIEGGIVRCTSLSLILPTCGVGSPECIVPLKAFEEGTFQIRIDPPLTPEQFDKVAESIRRLLAKRVTAPQRERA